MRPLPVCFSLPIVQLQPEFGGAGEDAVAFGTDAGAVAVAGVDHRVIGQSQQHVPNRADDGRFIAVASAGRARPAAEQGVAAEHDARGAIVEATATG